MKWYIQNIFTSPISLYLVFLSYSPKSHTFKFKLLDDIDLILNPAVGVVMWGVSSFAKCLKIVVLPLLSSPTRTILNSLSDDDRSFLNSESKPWELKENINENVQASHDDDNGSSVNLIHPRKCVVRTKR